MAKHSSHRRRKSHGKTQKRQRGGDLAGNPPSSWGWVNGTLGGGWTQFMNSLTLQPGQNLGTIQGNQSVPISNVNANNSQGMIGPNMTGDVPKGGQSGGRRHKGRKTRRHKRTKMHRGGFWGQAVVPGALLVANQLFGKKGSKKH